MSAVKIIFQRRCDVIRTSFLKIKNIFCHLRQELDGGGGKGGKKKRKKVDARLCSKTAKCHKEIETHKFLMTLHGTLIRGKSLAICLVLILPAISKRDGCEGTATVIVHISEQKWLLSWLVTSVDVTSFVVTRRRRVMSRSVSVIFRFPVNRNDSRDTNHIIWDALRRTSTQCHTRGIMYCLVGACMCQ